MNFSPMLQPLISALWYLVPILILAGIVKSPWFKGKIGEFLVNFSARLLLDKSRYHLIKNVTLPTEDGTTQIDHVLVSEFGVFVVETKNMKGWIFGSARQPFWTQKIFKSNHKFQNPLHQNYKHVKTLQTLLGLSDHQIHSVVVFMGSSTFKTPMPENVTQGLGYVRYIKSKIEPVLSLGQVAEVRQKVASGRLKASLATDRAHTRHVRGLVAERTGAPARRPRSGGVFKLLAGPVLVVIIGFVLANTYSSITLFDSSKLRSLTSKNIPEPISRKSESQSKARSDTALPAQEKTNSKMIITRRNQPPSELMLARQECNSLIAAALGNKDPRLLRDRDKACARYKIVQEESH